MPDRRAEATAFWITGPGEGRLQDEPLRPRAPDELLLRTLRSAVSKGTELLVFGNRVPRDQYQLMACPHMAGSFPFPVKYGYCNVGCVEEGPPALSGRRVFSLFPHQTRFVLPARDALPIPDEVPTERAVMAASMETAINATWDSRIAVGDRVAVIGLGVIGGLVAYLARAIPGVTVTAYDVNPDRRALADRLGVAFAPAPTAAATADKSITTGQAPYDVVFHTSASADGLQTALAVSGVETRIIELSWYGDRVIPLGLGSFFHSQRLQLISSQVGRIPPAHRSRWTHRRRLELAVSLLRDPLLDCFLSAESAFSQLPQTMEQLAQRPGGTLCHSIVY